MKDEEVNRQGRAARLTTVSIDLSQGYETKERSNVPSGIRITHCSNLYASRRRCRASKEQDLEL